MYETINVLGGRLHQRTICMEETPFVVNGVQLLIIIEDQNIK